MDPVFAREVMSLAGIDTAGSQITPLPGGVSAEVALVSFGDRDLVIKRALSELRVEEKWEADPGRIVAEGEALEWFHQLTPEHVPQPIAVVPERNALILPCAPQPCPNMRTLLVNRPEDWNSDFGWVLGDLLARWHVADPTPARGTSLDDTSRLESLRLGPFYRDLAARWPDHAVAISEAVTELLGAKVTVVHGDFTPKNVLFFGDSLWVIDTEVAHIGNPVLDTASMLAHLLLKEVHWRGNGRVREAVATTREGFLRGLSRCEASIPPSLGVHVGVILGVRVAGRARVDYLDAKGQEMARDAAVALLNGAILEEVVNRW